MSLRPYNVELANTKVMCGVYGPRQGGGGKGAGVGASNDMGRLDVDVKVATFATRGSSRGRKGQTDSDKVGGGGRKCKLGPVF